MPVAHDSRKQKSYRPNRPNTPDVSLRCVACFKNTELSPRSNKISAELKKYMTSMGRKISPPYSQVMMVSGCFSLTAVN